MRATLWLIVASLLIWGANRLGWWPVTVLIGVLFALLYAKKGKAILLSLLAGMIGWGLQLVILAILNPVLPLARLLGGILGLGGTAGTAVALLLPLIVGGLLALSGAWIASAIRAVLSGRSSSTAVTHGTVLEQ